MCLVYLLEQALEEDPVVVDHVDVLDVILPPAGNLPQPLVQPVKVCRLEKFKFDLKCVGKGNSRRFCRPH